MTDRLGIVDWGVGGLGLLGHLDRDRDRDRDRDPDQDRPGFDVVYWSDTGFAPYGLVPTGSLVARLRTIVVELADRGCTEVVLACNAASTVVDHLGAVPVPVAGIIASGISAVPDDLDGVIGVVGGRRTIRGGRYRRALRRPGRRIVSRVAQPLSAHIEAGRTGTVEFEQDLRRIVAPLRGADAVVLACTHYPAATDAFAAELPGTLLLDPAAHLAGVLSARLTRGTGERSILTTGEPDSMRSSARLAWGIELPEIARATPT